MPPCSGALDEEQAETRIQDQALLVLAQLMESNPAVQDRFLEARVDPTFLTCTSASQQGSGR